jgi:hypothetical protein
MISGYIGDTEALPNLIEMTRRQEFIFGGFYTGIATVHNGKLHRKRSIGAVSAFLTEHGQPKLPGCTGIAHSRTNDGGGIEWAQPRFDEHKDIATVGVGIGGVLDSLEETDALAETLLKTGAEFKTRIDGDKKNGITLSDGGVVHGAEVALIALGRLYRQGYSIPEAIRKLNIRSESVELLLTANEPDRLFVINHNSRLLVVSTATATTVSSSRMAVIDNPLWTMEIPANTIATITRNEVHCEVLWTDETLYDFTSPIGVANEVLEYLERHPGATWFEVLEQSIEPCFAGDKATLGYSVAHQVFEQLLTERKIRFEVRETRGVEGQFPVPQMILYKPIH